MCCAGCVCDTHGVVLPAPARAKFSYRSGLALSCLDTAMRLDSVAALARGFQSFGGGAMLVRLRH